MFHSTAQQFITYLRAVKNSSEHTIRNYAIDLNSFKSFLEMQHFPDVPTENLPPKISVEAVSSSAPTHAVSLDTIDHKTIRQFLAHLHSLKQKKRTVARRLCALRSFFSFACAHKFVTKNPSEEIEMPKIEKKLPQTLTFPQVLALFDQPDLSSYLGLRDRAILELFYSSGLRISELAALNRQDFDPESSLIKLKGKGKKERLIPITQTAASWILKYLNDPQRLLPEQNHLPEQDHEAIFLNCSGTRLTTRSIDRTFKSYLKASGLAGNITPHTIRHTIATHWLEHGMDLKTIQLLLGHSTLATTTIYTQVSPSLKKKTHQLNHPRA
ncbi:MAG: tyrosine recombinase XerC [Parachlamydiaceae bacterium]